MGHIQREIKTELRFPAHTWKDVAHEQVMISKKSFSLCGNCKKCTSSPTHSTKKQ